MLVALTWLTGQRKTLGAAAATLITLTFIFTSPRCYCGCTSTPTAGYQPLFVRAVHWSGLRRPWPDFGNRLRPRLRSVHVRGRRVCHAVDRPVFLSLDGDTMDRAAGRTRYAVLAGDTRDLHHTGLLDDVPRRALGAVSIARGFRDPELRTRLRRISAHDLRYVVLRALLQLRGHCARRFVGR